MKTIGDNIKYWRTERNMYQRALADKLGVGNFMLQQWECNQMVPTLKQISTIAEILEVDEYWLLYDDTECFKRYDLDCTNLYEHKKKEYSIKNYTYAVQFMNDKLKESDYKIIYHAELTQYEYYEMLKFNHNADKITDDIIMFYLLKHNSNFNMLFVESYIYERLKSGLEIIL